MTTAEAKEQSLVLQDTTVAISGASTLVGAEIINLLEERNIAVSEVKLFVDEDEIGEIYQVGPLEVAGESFDEAELEPVTLFFCAESPRTAGDSISKVLEANPKATCIDLSQHFAGSEDVPLILDSLNGASLQGDETLIACPNPLALAMTAIVSALQQQFPIVEAQATTLQAVSGAGQAALDELFEQTRAVFTQQEVESQAFAHQIAFNCLPQIDVFADNGFTQEELRIARQTTRLLEETGTDTGSFSMRVTAVRVPVFHGDTAQMMLESTVPFDVEKAKALIEQAEDLDLAHADIDYPTSFSAAGKDKVHVGRVRIHEDKPTQLHLWLSVDSIRTGSALNAIRILERLTSAGAE